jgi:TctA family transporter
MLLTVMALHGVAPGLDLIGNQLTLVFVLIWSLFLSNWLTSILGIASVGPLTRLTIVPAQVLVPVILSIVAMAAYVYRGLIGDVVLAVVVGIGGFYLKKHGWPRLPFVIAIVLGPLFERQLMLYLQLAGLGRISLWSRPIALAILGLIIVSLTIPLIRRRRPKRGIESHAR